MAFSSSEESSDATYTMGRSKGETERLIQQSQLYEGVTRRFFREAGIDSGMRVLDVGSGSGDVAFAAAELVGSDGAVIGVDVNGEILETARKRAKEAGLENVTFVEGDARTVDLPGHFDAIVGRLVLMYMADPAAALKEFANRLLPGGIVAFQELDFTPADSLVHPDTPLMDKIINWVVEVFRRSGAHTEMGLDLYRTFVDAGLPEPVLEWTAPVGAHATWSGYEYVASSFRSLLPLIEQYGIATSQEVDVATLAARLREEVVAAKRPAILPPHVTAWTRLPT
jgi:ubiquinone/menaquinone biosynthesis C-methylase UbiE